MSTVSQAAEYLLSARLNRETVENIPPSICPTSESAAYAIQDEIVAYLTELNHSAVCGYKLACTNKPIMELLGVEGPFSGRAGWDSRRLCRGRRPNLFQVCIRQ